MADVLHAIFGADLVYNYSQSVDFRRRTLVDDGTKLGVRVGLSEVPTIIVSLVDPSINFGDLLAEFPKITGVEPSASLENRGVSHHIITQGPPVAQRAHCLHP